MSSTPVNPNILTKGDDDTMDINVPGDKVVAQDISIDIAEGKRIMGKMKSDAVKEKRWTVKWG
jgi:predicted RNA-binding protein